MAHEVKNAPACDANDGCRYEAYGDGKLIGCADSLDDVKEYEPCCDSDFYIVDTQ